MELTVKTSGVLSKVKNDLQAQVKSARIADPNIAPLAGAITDVVGRELAALGPDDKATIDVSVSIKVTPSAEAIKAAIETAATAPANAPTAPAATVVVPVADLKA